jgi:putative membrane protein
VRFWDPARLVRAAVMLTWCAFLAYLWLGGGMVRYLGPRTYWVAAFGALALGGAGAAHVLAARSSSRRPWPSPKDGAGLLLMLIPIALALALPDAELGALAATRKAQTGVASGLALLPEPSGEVGFREVELASASREYAVRSQVGPGVEVELVGFVSRAAGGRSTEFQLTRFYVSCCAADAIPYSVEVVDGEGTRSYDDDTWLRASGTLVQRDNGLALHAVEVERVPPPRDPYLY